MKSLIFCMFWPLFCTKPSVSMQSPFVCFVCNGLCYNEVCVAGSGQPQNLHPQMAYPRKNVGDHLMQSWHAGQKQMFAASPSIRHCLPCQSGFGKRFNIWISENASSDSVSVFAGRKMQGPTLHQKGKLQLMLPMLAGNNLLLIAQKCIKYSRVDIACQHITVVKIFAIAAIAAIIEVELVHHCGCQYGGPLQGRGGRTCCRCCCICQTT